MLGGHGLTTVINELIEKSEANRCYVLSCDNILSFKKKYLKLTDKELIGFNEDNDYINKIPSAEAVQKNDYDINANYYNLAFIKRES